MSTLARGRLTRSATALLLLLMALPMASAPADARAGGGGSFGSRGSRSYSAPAPTTTAPGYAQPFNRSDSLRYGAPPSQRRFGFGTGLLAGLLGAGLMGSMFGGGFFGGIATLFGFLIKLALIGGVILLVVRLVRGRSQKEAFAGNTAARSGLGSGLPGGAPSGAAMGGPTAQSTGPATVNPEDYAAFERSLAAVQEAYSREDAATLSRLATPDMVREFGREIAANQQRGLRNDLSQVRLLQGDLSEAWSEGAVTYATVAMRFTAVDVMLERNSARIVSGDPVKGVEAVELWTFRRDGRGPWILSAIQQAG